MRILNTLLSYLKKSFKLPKDPKLTRMEASAIKNIISVAKERIWLDDPINAQEYNSDNFEESLGMDSVDNIKKSISIAEQYILKYTDIDTE